MRWPLDEPAPYSQTHQCVMSTMQLAVSNIGLTAFDHADELRALSDMGVSGVEVAPSRVWADTWHGLSSRAVETYRRDVEAADLQVVGLHSLIFDHPDLGLFKDAETRRSTLAFFAHLSGVCRDLGGKTLIWGGGRHRGDLPEPDALEEAERFMSELEDAISVDGTCFCFEPLGPNDSDFVNSALTSLEIVRRVNRDSLAVQLDAKALAENDEINAAVFDAVKPRLVHVHANEPGLGIVGNTGAGVAVNHAAIGCQLHRIGYDGFVSIEQRQLNQENPLIDLEQSVGFVTENYLSGGEKR